MKYQIPIYKLEKGKEVQLGNIIVEKNSLGVYEMISGNKIRVVTGLVNICEAIKENNIFVKSCDFNGSHLVVPKGTVKGIHKNRFYDYDKYVKEHKKVKKFLKTK